MAYKVQILFAMTWRVEDLVVCQHQRQGLRQAGRQEQIFSVYPLYARSWASGKLNDMAPALVTFTAVGAGKGWRWKWRRWGGGKGGMSIKEVITYVVNQLHT